MTAEVAVINRSAVALAADSLVTISREGKQAKTYNANKLFMLSKYAPMGIMVFGNAVLNGVPWETIIKVYRRDSGDKKFPKTADYASNLVKYISRSRLLFPADSQESFYASVVTSFLEDMNSDIDEHVRSHVEKHKKVTPAEVEEFTASIINAQYSELRKAKARPTLPTTFFRDLKAAYGAEVTVAIDHYLKNKPLTSILKNRLATMAVWLFSKDVDLPNSHSGIVIAGFGEDECFPVIKTYSFLGVVCNRLIHRFEDSQSVDGLEGGVRGGVIPFAQRDVADAFLQGIDRVGLNFVSRYVSNLFEDLTQSIDSSLDIGDSERDKLKKNLQSLSKKAMTDLTAGLHKYLRKHHIDPLLQTVINLPKEELANLAEALVNLTAIKRKIQLEVETVGGPIDVAVISKGDGFVWIKRKHYFSRDLNPTFTKNYLNR